MKNFIFIVFFLFSLSFQSYGQEQTLYFSQGLFQLDDEATIQSIENQIKNDQLVSVVRLDRPTKRFFILAKEEINTTNLTNWFGTVASTLHCMQFGKYGVDALKPYPFVDCND
ncbi:MAG: hypothetical protein M9916_10310 [Crocinitomicaceae bacterium]|nr:hypothetical protein [Crocinitomicaceae bacterium]